MKYWYQKPHSHLKDAVQTVLVLEGSSEPIASKLPLVTTGMPVLISRFQKGSGNLPQLKLFATPAPRDCWQVDKKTTIVSYFFKPFVIAPLFNIPAAKLAQGSIHLANWNAHMINALNIQFIPAISVTEKVDVLDHFLIRLLNKHATAVESIRLATDEMLHQADT